MPAEVNRPKKAGGRGRGRRTERTPIVASTGVCAAQLALHGDGTHLVSRDMAIETMRQTGLDMMTKYKETSEGGLAVNVTVC